MQDHGTETSLPATDEQPIEGLAPSLPSTVARVDTPHGPMYYAIDDAPIGHALREYGEWSMHEFRVLEACVRVASSVLDVGANIGSHALGLARAIGPQGTLHAFEPRAFPQTLLLENLRSNGQGQAVVHRACVGAEGGCPSLAQHVPDAHADLGADGADGTATVPVLTLDGMALHNVSLLRIDAERAAAAVLLGARRILEEQTPVLYFKAKSVEGSIDALRFMKGRPYALYLHRSPAFNARNYRKSAHNIFGVATETNVLAVPLARVEELAALLRNEELTPFETIDRFAELLLAAPRHGDTSPIGRSAPELAQALADANELIVQENERAGAVHRHLHRARDRVRDLEAQVGRRRRQQAALASQVEALTEARAALESKHERSARGLEQRIAILTHALMESTGRTRRRDYMFHALPNEVRLSLPQGLRATFRRTAKLSARARRHREERAIIEASGLFDPVLYLAQSDALDPIGHYLETGAAKGFKPCAEFDTRFYVRTHPELARSPENPFVHYLKVGKPKGEPGRAPPAERADAAKASANSPKVLPLLAEQGPKGSGVKKPVRAVVTLPTESEWSACRPCVASDAKIDVILPVFRGYTDTLRAVQRVLTSENRTPFELIVIDDESPEPELSTALMELAAAGFFTYLRNEENLGFVATVNRGMSLHPDRDVLLLNSDTEVFHDWLDRLQKAAHASDDIATVTPFSNSATICSYPFGKRDNDEPLEVSYAELDAIAAAENAGVSVEIPTAVGFCMYIRRDCLSRVGLFDVENFGKGYGEENDFCRRALELGLRSVIACDVFVRHTGGASFQGEKAERVERAQKRLDALHPGYAEAVREHAKEQPVLPYRERIDLARLRRKLGGRMLAMVTHQRGGGTEQHVQQLIEIARAEGMRVLVLRPGPDRHTLFTASLDDMEALPNLRAMSLEDPVASARFLDSIGVFHMHVHHLVDFPDAMHSWVESVARDGILTVDFTVHDYSPVCPQVNFVDHTGMYCGEPAKEDACNRCIVRNGSRFGVVAIGPYRRRHARMLARMRRVFVPNVDVQARLKHYFPSLETTVIPHPEPLIPQQRAPKLAREESLKVAVLGAIGVHKGFDVLLRCVADAKERDLPLEFVVVGYTCDDPRLAAEGVHITGAYQSPAEALELLHAVGAHVSFFPAVWPETYAYTLNVSDAAGLHAVAFDLGAIAQRLRAKGTGTLLPVDFLGDPQVTNDALLALRAEGARESATPDQRTLTLADYYAGVL
jgi:FkbM family methyltransferase